MENYTRSFIIFTVHFVASVETECWGRDTEFWGQRLYLSEMERHKRVTNPRPLETNIWKFK